MRLLVISGLSGSGKSIALQALEDLDYYCVDNLPLSLLPQFVDQIVATAEKRNIENVAVGIDARNLSRDLGRFGDILDEIRKPGLDCSVIFLGAADNVLIKRFSETRRKHPLTRVDVSLLEAIAVERELLAPIAASADLHIDTSNFNVHQLRGVIRERVAQHKSASLSILFMSFGYKYGIPTDADFVFDVRCLPNPHWDPTLRMRKGNDPEVIRFLGQQPAVVRMYDDIRAFLERWIPSFEAENRNYMSVAIGCTGGQHRSVYLAESLAAHFRQSRAGVMTRHRELR
ncbi:MAG: RNase adapter RapZ [Gammaproteobacteria bacterium]|nr:RNase adapter RapZ [Gammaproteobacteria bacterium]